MNVQKIFFSMFVKRQMVKDKKSKKEAKKNKKFAKKKKSNKKCKR